MSARELCVAGVSKRFGGVQALKDVSMLIRPGETVGIIGPNGSGKSTLFNVLTGVERPDEGRVAYGELELSHTSLSRISKMGIARTFQSLRLFGDLTAVQNVVIGQHSRVPPSALFGLNLVGKNRHWKEESEERAREWLRTVGLGHRMEHFAYNLSYGQMKRLELARALSSNPDLLLLDEPAAGLNDTGAGEMVDLIKTVKERNGGTVVIIEHNVRVLLRIVDRVIVMDSGAVRYDGLPSAVTDDAGVVAAYLGDGEDA